MARGPTTDCVPFLRRKEQEDRKVGFVSSLTEQEEHGMSQPVTFADERIHVHDNYCKHLILRVVLGDLIARTFVPIVCMYTKHLQNFICHARS